MRWGLFSGVCSQPYNGGPEMTIEELVGAWGFKPRPLPCQRRHQSPRKARNRSEADKH